MHDPSISRKWHGNNLEEQHANRTILGHFLSRKQKLKVYGMGVYDRQPHHCKKQMAFNTQIIPVAEKE